MNDEWGACMVVFKEDHERDFKFLHCWEELRHCTKWHSSTDEKETRDVSRQGRVGKSRASNRNINRQGPGGTIFDSCSPGLESINDSCNNPNINAADSTLGTPFNVDENPPISFHYDAPIQRPLGQKSAKEKRRRSGAGISEASSAASERLTATVYAWRESLESRFESLKQTAEEQAFHAIKNAKLESV
ncbi:glutathione S-transferase T3-like [Iris pallida]|uniref:Glutathione S-transferase T3-like n=1 Tax=Iris pallida TaxID=29817 RepID=A0AAX6GLX1_IRIPA|nr:glutathione S-transferase T3-like [Iris pallida]